MESFCPGEFLASVSIFSIRCYLTLSFRLAWESNNFISWLFDDSFGSSKVVTLFHGFLRLFFSRILPIAIYLFDYNDFRLASSELAKGCFMPV